MVSVGPALADELQVKVVSATSVVALRGPIKLVVQTDPSATCGRNIHWQLKQMMGDYSPRQKTAGDDGMIEWTWSAPETSDNSHHSRNKNTWGRTRNNPTSLSEALSGRRVFSPRRQDPQRGSMALDPPETAERMTPDDVSAAAGRRGDP